MSKLKKSTITATHLRLPDILVPRPGDKADLATGHEVAQRRLQVEEQQQHYILCSVVTVRRLNTKYKLIIANGCQHFELLCPESRPELIIDFTLSPIFCLNQIFWKTVSENILIQ